MPSATNPLLVELPEDIDTNRTYRLVGPSGEHWQLDYDDYHERWVLQKF